MESKAQLGHVVVVGGSLAGVRAGEELRRRGYSGRISLVGAERHFPPFDRPPLSKDFLLGSSTLEQIRLRVFEDIRADLRLGCRAAALDMDARAVTLDSGERIAFDGLVVATGTSVRRLACRGADLVGVHCLYSAEDATAVKVALARSRRVVVVGGGFVAAEAASVCRQLGADVTLVSRSKLPLRSAVGQVAAMHLLDVHEQAGVRPVVGTEVESIQGDGAVAEVTLTNGDVVPADIVLVGIGSVPATEWLSGSGLDISDGVICDQHCVPLHSGDVPIVAAGDVASWHNPLLGQRMRVAHWTNAVEQAEYAAGALLGERTSDGFGSLPFLWSDQYDLNVHMAGTVGDATEVLHGSLEGGAFVLALGRDGVRTGIVGVNMTGAFQRERRRLASDLRDRRASTDQQ